MLLIIYLRPKYHINCIILTTYNELSRKEMYSSRIEWWINNTSLPIYVVDSSNNGFPELIEKYKSLDRLHIFVFDQTKYIRSKRFHQTKYEVLSLKMAYEHFEKEWQKYTCIIKITGKYVLPDLENELKEIPFKNDLILQYRHKLNWQNTEILGIKRQIYDHLLTWLSTAPGKLFERQLSSFLKINKNYKTYRIPLLYIPKDYKTATKQGFKYISL